MHFIRRSVSRAVSSSSSASFVSSQRSISSRSSPFLLRSCALEPRLAFSPLFRRLASSEAKSSSADIGGDSPALADGVAAAGQTPQARSVLAASNAIYVGNISFDMQETDLSGEFNRFGEIEELIIARDNMGRSKGFGYVQYKAEANATDAIAEMNGSLVFGREILVNYRTSKGNPNFNFKNSPSRCLYIGNLPYEMSDAEINKIFREFTGIIEVRIAVDRRTGQPRGFAHADFSDIESATKAKDTLAGMVLYGRMLRLDFTKSKLTNLPKPWGVEGGDQNGRGYEEKSNE